MQRHFVAALAVFALVYAEAAGGQVVQAPVVKNSAGLNIGATPVITVDPSGEYVAPGEGGGGGAGTEYDEDAAAPANPSGPTFVCVRRDTLSISEVSANGDWLTCTVTNKGELRTSDLDLKTALGSPFQAGGSIGNTAFGISGTLPAFASTPTFNLGTLNGAATAANQTTLQGYVDTLEALIASTNTKLDTLDTRVDGLETAITAANASLDDIELAAESATSAKVQGGIASGAAFSENPTPGGCRASSTVPTAVDDGDVVADRCDLYGNPINWPYTARSNLLTGMTAAMTGTTSTAVTGMGAPGAGLYNYITTLVCGNSHATVGTFVELQDGSGGTTFFTVPAAAVYGGSVLPFPAPLKQPTSNTALYVKNTTTGANVICSAAGFKAP